MLPKSKHSFRKGITLVEHLLKSLIAYPKYITHRVFVRVGRYGSPRGT